jgi:hypothetical protein
MSEKLKMSKAVKLLEQSVWELNRRDKVPIYEHN